MDFTSGDSTPAVDGDVVYVTGVCGVTAAIRRSDGSQIWEHVAGCDGGGGSDAVIANGRVYSNRRPGGSRDDAYIIDQASGRRLGTFTSSTTPIVGKHNFITLQDGFVMNRTPDGKTLKWRTKVPTTERGNGRLTQALLIGQVVYVVLDTGAEDHPDDNVCNRRAGSLQGFRLRGGAALPALSLGDACDHSTHDESIAAANNVAAIPLGTRLVVVG